jgi:hypothetical protein
VTFEIWLAGRHLCEKSIWQQLQGRTSLLWKVLFFLRHQSRIQVAKQGRVSVLQGPSNKALALGCRAYFSPERSPGLDRGTCRLCAPLKGALL